MDGSKPANTEPKPKLQPCPVCKAWIPAGSIGPIGCLHCHGRKK